jgi:hypothetical protein
LVTFLIFLIFHTAIITIELLITAKRHITPTKKIKTNINFKFTKTGKQNTYVRTYFLMKEQPRYKIITIQKKR